MKNEQRDIPTLVEMCKNLKEDLSKAKQDKEHYFNKCLSYCDEICKLKNLIAQLKSDLIELKHKLNEQKNLH
jgi:peptidoglycan hydrolase CwlO-like protein